MGKILVRVLIVTVLSLAVLALGWQGIAWAGVNPWNAPQAPANAPSSSAVTGNPGTVLPPPAQVVIGSTGSYSVRGFVNVNVLTITGGITVKTTLLRALPSGFSPHLTRMGSNVSFYDGTTFLDTLTPAQGTVQVCFAAIPNHTNTIMYYDSYAASPTWTSLTTTVSGGQACVAATGSGIYALTFQ